LCVFLPSKRGKRNWDAWGRTKKKGKKSYPLMTTSSCYQKGGGTNVAYPCWKEKCAPVLCLRRRGKGKELFSAPGKGALLKGAGSLQGNGVFACVQKEGSLCAKKSSLITIEGAGALRLCRKGRKRGGKRIWNIYLITRDGGENSPRPKKKREKKTEAAQQTKESRSYIGRDLRKRGQSYPAFPTQSFRM